MNADIQGKLDAIVAPFQSVIDAAAAIPALVDAAEKASFDAGQASIVLPSPTDPAAQYTQADMDKLAVQVRAENADALAAKDAALADLQAKVDAGVVDEAAMQAKYDALVARVKDVEGKLLAELGN